MVIHPHPLQVCVLVIFFYILIWSVLGTVWFGVNATMLLVGMGFFLGKDKK